MFRTLGSVGIGAKLAMAFTAILLCTLVLGLFSLGRLDAVNASAKEIANTWLPETRVLGRLAQISERMRQNRASMMLAVTDAEREVLHQHHA